MDSVERRDAVFPNCTMACFNPSNPENCKKFADIIPRTYNTLPQVHRDWETILNKGEEMIYAVRSDAAVFCCWDYAIVRDTVGLKNDVIGMYWSYLKGVFATFIDKLKDGTIDFHFVVDDFRKLDQYLLESDTFDRISTSNLSDYYHFPLMLKLFGSRLNKNNACSVLVTHHENWIERTDVMNYVISQEDSKLKTAENDAKIRKQVLWDVPALTTGLNVIGSPEDYCDTNSYLLQSLLSEVGAYSILHDGMPVAKPTIMHPSEVAKKFGLRLRDFYTELNHVIPFKVECNMRRISVQVNNKRFLEWTPFLP